MNEELKLYLYVFRAEVIWEISIYIVIQLHKNIKKERVEFHLKVFFWKQFITGKRAIMKNYCKIMTIWLFLLHAIIVIKFQESFCGLPQVRSSVKKI